LIRLEDPEAKETQEFVQSNVLLTASVLEKCVTRDKLKNQITAYFDYPKYSCPYKRGKHFFYMHNSGLQAQSVLYIQVGLSCHDKSVKEGHLGYILQSQQSSIPVQKNSSMKSIQLCKKIQRFRKFSGH
jgi:prolyl oligopeptidase PreP (S9A serine peptidase family)